MAFTHGKNTVFKMDSTNGGSLADISTYLTSVGFPRSADIPETTTFGATYKTYISGFTDATISLEGNWDPTVDAMFAAHLGAANTVSYEYGPEGATNAVDVKFSGEAILTSYEVSSGINDVTTFSAELQCSGAITRNTTW